MCHCITVQFENHHIQLLSNVTLSIHPKDNAFVLTKLSPVSHLKTFAQQLQLTLMRSPLSATATHIALVLTETAPLIRRFLYAGCVHQMESALILIMVVCILTATSKLRLIFIWVIERISVCHSSKHFYNILYLRHTIN
jgi:hypothetical protein